MPDFEYIFNNCPEKIKLEFLENKIIHNQPLQTEFLAYLKSQRSPVNPVPSEKFNQLDNRIRKKYKDLFEKVDVENPDWDNYVPPHSGYIEDWESYQLASEQEFERIFEDFGSAVTDKILSHSFDEVLAMLAGMYKATQDAEIEDDIGSFSDVNEFLLDEHATVMHNVVEKLKISAVPGKYANVAIKLFLNYCDAEYPGNPHFPAWFEPLLMALADKSDQPELIQDMINQSKVDLPSVARLILLLLKKSGKNEEWLQTARIYYRGNNAIAREMLEYYFKTDKASFLAVAREMFPLNKREWAEFLQHYLLPDNDRDLFVRVFSELTAFHCELEFYHKIKKLITPSEYEQLLSQTRSNTPFVARLLAEEKRFEEIKRLVEKYPSDWEYTEVIEPILTIYPEFCLENIRSRVSRTLVNERGRHIYEKIASWLKSMKTIPGFEPEKHCFILQTHNHKPNLPALKDEMRKAGLI